MDVLAERGDPADATGRWLRTLSAEIHKAAVEPLAVLWLVAVMIGTSVVFGAEAFLRPQGMAARIPAVVAYAIPCEILPVLIAILFILRSGTMLAAEIGMARAAAWEQTGAREKSEWDPAVPRIAGFAAAAMALAACMSAFAISGGVTMVNLLAAPSASLQLGAIVAEISPRIVGVALAKAALLGALVAAINYHVALRAGRSTRCIPAAIARGALYSALGCLLVDAALSALAWL